ncbi:MAG: Fur family transcriptional regulator [Calditrichia bacterium]
MQALIDDFIKKSKEKGYNVTFQRVAIYKILLQHRDHPSAEQIYNEIKQEHPTISLATVYKTLDTLNELGLIHKVNPLYDTARYETQMHAHHHLICLRCHDIVDISTDELGELDIPENFHNFDILNYQIQISGICSRCRQ